MCLLEKKELQRSFFCQSKHIWQFHFLLLTIYFPFKIQMSLGKEKSWILKHREDLTKNFILIVHGN